MPVSVQVANRALSRLASREMATSKHISDPTYLATLPGRPMVPFFTADDTVNADHSNAQCVPLQGEVARGKGPSASPALTPRPLSSPPLPHLNTHTTAGPWAP